MKTPRGGLKGPARRAPDLLEIAARVAEGQAGEEGAGARRRYALNIQYGPSLADLERERNDVFAVKVTQDPIVTYAAIADPELKRAFGEFWKASRALSEIVMERTARYAERLLREAFAANPRLTQAEAAEVLLIGRGPSSARLLRFRLAQLGLDWRKIKRAASRPA